jgi:hypothetical protein
MMDYFLVGIAVATAIYTAYRLFLGWRISVSSQGNRMPGAAGLVPSNVDGQKGITNK